MKPFRPTPLIVIALIASPGLAPAQGIEISGTAEMGLMGGSHLPQGTRARLLTDLDLQIRMSTTTDGGLTFGVEFDLDDLETDLAGRAPWLPPPPG